MAKLVMLWAPDEDGAEAIEGAWLSLLEHMIREGRLGGLTRIVNNRATPVEVRPQSDSGKIGWLGVTEFWLDDCPHTKAAVEALGQERALTNVRTAMEDRSMVDTGERPLLVKVDECLARGSKKWEDLKANAQLSLAEGAAWEHPIAGAS